MKAEQAKSRAEHKAKLQTKIDNLNKKLNAKSEQAKQRSEQQEKEAKAKVKALEKKAAEAKGEAKAAIEKRIAGHQREIEKVLGRLSQLDERCLTFLSGKMRFGRIEAAGLAPQLIVDIQVCPTAKAQRFEEPAQQGTISPYINFKSISFTRHMSYEGEENHECQP